jgi:sRNA-binding carbon storage regulator CsrA
MMQSLDMEIGEKIVIRTAKGDIVIKYFCETHNGSKFGFDAARHIKIYRSEISRNKPLPIGHR